MDLQKQIDEILELYTQSILADSLGISHGGLLEKIRDNNFTEKEALNIMNIYSLLYKNRHLTFLEYLEYTNPYLFEPVDIIVYKYGAEIHYKNKYTAMLHNAI